MAFFVFNLWTNNSYINKVVQKIQNHSVQAYDKHKSKSIYYTLGKLSSSTFGLVGHDNQYQHTEHSGTKNSSDEVLETAN